MSTNKLKNYVVVLVVFIMGVAVIYRGGINPPGGGIFVSFGGYAYFIGSLIILFALYLLFCVLKRN